MRLRKRLTQKARLIQRNNRYSVGETLLALLYPMILGLERNQSTQLLRQNGVFQYLTGLPSYPEATTLRRFLLRVAPTALPRLRALHDRFLYRMTVHPRVPARLIFDVDSTVLVVYGKQEQARIGYNPIKRGRPSYHPLLCFDGQSNDFWHGELRPGDAHTARGTLDLLQACFAKIPAGVRAVIVRADKGFYDHTLIEWLEAHAAGFVIVARPPAPIKRKLGHLRYVSPSRGIEVAEFRYQPTRWPHPYRFVAVRRPEPEEPTAQLTLFKLGKYHCQVLVTNLPLRPLNLWRFYNDRAAVELLIKQLKGDYARQHPHPPLLRQRDLLPSPAAGLQSRQLVYAPLPAPGGSERHSADAAAQDPAHARPTAPSQQSPPLGSARKRPARGGLEVCPAQNPDTQAAMSLFTPDSG